MVTTEPLRIAFFGTPRFALATLDALLSSPHHVACVVTQPDRPRGRGQKPSDAPVKARAVSAGLPCLQPAALKESSFVESLTTFRLDLGVVAAYGRILPEVVLAIPRLGMVNVHASLLPRYRGAAPVHRAVIAGETETGVTIMRVVKALDAGPMLAAEQRPIADSETSEEVERDLATMGASLLVRVLDDIASGAARETIQDERLATYAPSLRKEEGRIDWGLPAKAIHDLIRGLYPWPRAFTFRDHTRIVLLKSAVAAADPAGAPGTVLEARGDVLRIATGRGALDVVTLQPEGGRAMSARDFLAGHHVRPGDRLGR
jgi:methionyl-tRNA formyltransferase